MRAALLLETLLRGREVAIRVRMEEDTGLSRLLDDRATIHPVGFQGILSRLALVEAPRDEILAQAIHHEYFRHQRRAGQARATNPSLVPWREPPESLRMSNRDQAGHIDKKLVMIGCRIVPRDGIITDLMTFTREQVEALDREGARPRRRGSPTPGVDAGAEEGRGAEDHALPDPLGGARARRPRQRPQRGQDAAGRPGQGRLCDRMHALTSSPGSALGAPPRGEHDAIVATSPIGAKWCLTLVKNSVTLRKSWIRVRASRRSMRPAARPDLPPASRLSLGLTRSCRKRSDRCTLAETLVVSPYHRSRPGPSRPSG
jgi:hypothetical protein